MTFVLKHKRYFALGFWLWLLIILLITLLPQSHRIINIDTNSKFRLDYTIHFLVYFSLSVLFIFWRIDEWLKISNKELLWYIFSGIAICAITELLQFYIPERTFNKTDLLFNILGVIVGIVLIKLILNKKAPRNQDALIY
ncbi:MAG: VanZ family protein [Bacteroidales bacterium]|nr:VanZ family protein [Bacteroidales bacterium]